MASPTLKELQYRKFDDLLNEVYIDLPTLTREGMVEPAQLIKIAQTCNYELGLKIYKTKETLLVVEHGRTKLPSDFHMLNYAVLCSHYRVCEPGLFNGLHTEDVAVPVMPPAPSIASDCYCWTIASIGGACPVTLCDGTFVQWMDFPSTIQPDGSLGSITMCLRDMQLGTQKPDGSRIIATKGGLCYNDPNTAGYSCNVPPPFEGCCTPTEPDSTCGKIDSDPWHQNKVYTTCNGRMEVNVIEYHSNEIREYSSFEQIRMVPSKEASSFCVNTSFRNAPHTGNIKDGFLWVPTMRERGGNGHGRMYICYLGAMEDEDGNLLVLDHPKINEYYEWALKERILQNLYLNGETDLLQRWQMAKKERDTARKEALSITTMPDFYELKQTIESNRRAMYKKYLHPFSSLYGNTPDWPWSYNNEHI